MRFYIFLITLSVLIWAVAEGVPSVGVDNLKSKAVTSTPDASTDALVPGPEPAVAAPEMAVAAAGSTPATTSPQEIANGSAPAAPGGPNTSDEEKADLVLSCIDHCPGDAKCQNDCITSGYNVNMNSILPVIPATVSSPISSTSTAVFPTITTASVSGGAVSTVTGSSTPTSTAGAHGSSAIVSNVLGMQKVVGAIIAVGAASMFVSL